LARVYAVGADAPTSAAVLEPMGFAPVDGAVSVGVQEVGAWSLEFGPLSVDGWLARHVEIESTRPAPPTSAGGAPAVVPDAVRSLSAREREVLSVLAIGVTNRELAERLFISERTANRHLSNIFVKLGVRNRTEAARVAVAAGLG
jgi:DNA-binding NarL/FixJ family response regulator